LPEGKTAKTVEVKYPVAVPNTSLMVSTVGITNLVCIDGECVLVLAFETDRKDFDPTKYFEECTIYETEKGYHIICPQVFKRLEDFIDRIKGYTESFEWISRQYQLQFVYGLRGFTLRCGKKYSECDIKLKQLRIRNRYQALMVLAYELCRMRYCKESSIDAGVVE